MWSCFCALLWVLLFSTVNKDSVKIGNENIIFISTGFKSCNECYAQLYSAIKEDKKLKSCKIFFVSEYKQTIISRKQYRNYLIQTVKDSSIEVIFDEAENSFHQRFNVNISPSVVAFYRDSILYLDYSRFFRRNEVDKNALKDLSMFFKSFE